MLRRCVSAAAVLFVLCGFVVAGTYQGMITKIEKDSVTFKTKGKKGEKGEEKTIKLGTSVKIMKMKGKDKEGEEAKAEDITTAIENSKGKAKGVFAKIETDGEGDAEKVTKISFGGRGKGKKKE